MNGAKFVTTSDQDKKLFVTWGKKELALEPRGFRFHIDFYNDQ
jgi:hypothetical protein